MTVAISHDHSAMLSSSIIICSQNNGKGIM